MDIELDLALAAVYDWRLMAVDAGCRLARRFAFFFLVVHNAWEVVLFDGLSYS